MTTNKSSHAKCSHPNTKSARSKCRAERQKWDAKDVEWDAEMAELQKDRDAEAAWATAFEKFAGDHQASAHQNADDTAAEEGFEMYSRRWHEVALSSLHSARDNSQRCYNLSDPENGSYVYRERRYQWVDGVRHYAQGGAEVILVDDLGVRTTHKIADLIAEREAEEAAE